MDALYATELEEYEGFLTGRTASELLDEEGKVAALRDFCTRHGFSPQESAAVGDGANDIRMLASAGLAILYTSISPNNVRPLLLNAVLEWVV
jgi:phosphoserine phosphatase